MNVEDLTQDDRDRITRFLSSPLQFPQEFRQWLPDWLATNVPFLPVSQISGYRSTRPQGSIVNDTETVSSPSFSWMDLPSDGPRISKLSDGMYFVIWGWFSDKDSGTGGVAAWVGPSVNDADPTVYADSAAHLDQAWMNWKASLVRVSGNQDNNDISLKYMYRPASSATLIIERRWLVVMRIS